MKKTMRAVVATKYIESEADLEGSLKVVDDRAVPVAGCCQVLVRVEAASINPVDYKLLLSNFAGVPTIPSVPYVPGFDFSGRVESLGASYKGRFKAGDLVWGKSPASKQASFAELLAVDDRNLALKPPSLTHAEAASLPLVALTGYQALLQQANFKAGQRVLVLGAGGGTGSAGVQLARALGASYVAATCGAAAVEMVRGLGADRVIDYRAESWADVLEPGSIDVIYDTVGGVDSWNQCPRVLAKGGAFVTIAGDRQDKLTLGRLLGTAGSIVNRKFWSLTGNPRYYYFTLSDGQPERLDHLSRMVAAGQLRPVVEASFPLDQVVTVYRRIMSGRTRGKLVINIGPNADSKE